MEHLPSTHRNPYNNTYNSTEYRSYYYSDAESSRQAQHSLNGRIVSDQETDTALQLLGLSRQQPVITQQLPVGRSPSPPPLPPPSPPRKNLLYLKMSKVDSLENLLHHHTQHLHQHQHHHHHHQRSRSEKPFKRRGTGGHLRRSSTGADYNSNNNNNNNNSNNDTSDKYMNEHINHNDNSNYKESITSSPPSPFSSSFSSFSSSSSSSPSSSRSSSSQSPSSPTPSTLPMLSSSAFSFSGNQKEKKRRLSEDSHISRSSSIYSDSKRNSSNDNSNDHHSSNNKNLPDWSSIALSISEKMKVGDEVGIHALISQTLWSTIPPGEEARLSVADNAELALYTRRLTQESQARPYRPPSPIPMSPQQQHHQQLLIEQQQLLRRHSPPPPPPPVMGLNYLNHQLDHGARPPIFIAHNSPSRVKKKKNDPALASTQSDAISTYASANPIITMNPANNKKLKTYPCMFPNCGKLFSRLYNLKSHSRTHTNERPYPCELCVLAFSRNHDLKRHMKIHEGDKPYRCLGCEKAFTRLDALKRHKTNNRSRSSCIDTPLSYP